MKEAAAIKSNKTLVEYVTAQQWDGKLPSKWAVAKIFYGI